MLNQAFIQKNSDIQKQVSGSLSKKQAIDLQYKKEPKQARAKATCKAIIQASAQILEEEGYGGLTTNGIAERAGVSIGSVYEYFPGKEAIVAAVATRLVESMLDKMQAALQHAETLELEQAMQTWIYSLYSISREEHKLLKVLLFQVPFIYQVPAVAGMRTELFRLALVGASKTREQYLIQLSRESLYLITTMTGATLLQMALMPPPGLNLEAVLDELSQKMVQWLYQVRDEELEA
ncbi:MAG: TetR family transcriptional regulator [Pseudomonadales bacterium]|nr:TetR family transcriptional regulator [Pseudomonadales bacterium]